MTKYNQKPFTAEEKKKAIEQYCEKIQYSPRYSSECLACSHIFALVKATADLQMKIGNIGELKLVR